MTDENTDVNAQSSSANDVSSDSSQTQQSSQADKKEEKKNDDGMVPRERLNEEAAKRKEAERKAAEREERLQQLESVLKGTKSQGERDDALESFAQEYNIPVQFVEKLAKVISPKLASKPDPIALEAHAEVRFAQELDDLESEMPEVAEMTKEEKKELKKRRFSPEFIRTPLRTIARDLLFDKQSKKSFESSRAGGKTAQSAADSREFKSNMSVDEAREWFAKNTSYGKKRH